MIIKYLPAILTVVSLLVFSVAIHHHHDERLKQEHYQRGITHYIDSIDEHLISEYWEETDSTIIVTQIFEK